MPEAQVPGTDIALGVKQPQSGIGLLGEFAKTQNMLNQNKLFQQQFMANQAVGEVARNSVAEDGTLDLRAFEQGISQDPRTAFKAPEILNMLEQRRQTQQLVLKEQLGNMITQQTLFLQALAPISEMQNPTHQDVKRAAVGLMANAKAAGVTSGIFSPEGMATALAQLQDIPAGEALGQRLKQITTQAQSAKDQAELLMGKIEQVDLGGAQTQRQIAPWMGTNRLVGAQEKTATPGEANAIVNVPEMINGSPTGREIPAVRGMVGPMVGGQIPQSVKEEMAGNAIARTSGYAQGTTPKGNPLVTPPAPQGHQGEPMPTGNAGTVAPTERTGAPSNGPQSTLPRGGLGAKPSPQEQKAMEDVAATEADLAESIAAMTPMMQLIEGAEKTLKNVTPGKFAEARSWAGSVGKDLGRALKDGGWISEEKAKDFDKWADQMANGSLPASQTYQMFAVLEAVRQLTASVQGQGRTMKSEVDTVLSHLPDLTRDPEAIRAYYNEIKDIYRMATERQAFVADWRQSMYDPQLAGTPGHRWGDFGTEWSKHVAKSGRITVQGKETPYRAEPEAKPRPSIEEIRKSLGME